MPATRYIMLPAVDETADLTPTERDLFAAITYRCHKYETDERSNAELAQDRGRHYVTISRTLAALCRKGYITISGRTSARRIGITYKGAAASAYTVTAIYNEGEELPKRSSYRPAVKLADIIAGAAHCFDTCAKSVSRAFSVNAKSEPDIHIYQNKSSTTKEDCRPEELPLLKKIQQDYYRITGTSRTAAAMAAAGY